MAARLMVRAQEKTPVKFGKVSPADFDLSAYKFDSSANAVVIADVGRSEFVGNTKGWFSLEFRHYKRIKILNRNGFDAATVAIPLYTSGMDIEKVNGLKAVTYNLENGKVVETKLDDNSVFTDKTNKHWSEKKFTFPAIKEGSILELSYIQSSDFFAHLQPWTFQGMYPCLWSEYEADIPNFFEYVTLTQGYLPYSFKNSSSRPVNFRITLPGGAGRDETGSFSDEVVDRRWVMKNVPPMKEEPYTTTLDNYVAKIEFQLSRFNFPHLAPEDRMGSWVSVSKELLKDEDFGADLDKGNGWLNEEMSAITKGVTGDLEKAKKIYAYVRDNFTNTGSGSFHLSNPVKTVFKNKNGTSTDLNLLLTAMLNHAKIRVDPVILSTRSNGFTHEFYPLTSRFNYVICQAVIDSNIYYLDASEPWLGFGRLPQYCYNGHARIINTERPLPVYFDADSVTESKTTMVFIVNDEKAKGAFSGRVQSSPGYFESCNVREKIRKKGEKEYFSAIQTAYGGDVSLSGTQIDSLKFRDLPVTVSYDFVMKNDTASDMIYFNPMLDQAYKENPFSAAERVYPVEMPAAMDETYILNMEIPQGYVVDELPKQAKVLFNDDEGFFEYLVAKGDANIQLRSRIKLKKANFKPEDYNTLRDLFAFIVKKENEQIVFKKKK